MRIKSISVLLLLSFVFFSDCNNKESSTIPELLIYCGITVAGPVQEIADIIETQENCKITILLDGSQNLLDIIDVNKVGDLYLPGSITYLDSAFRKGHLLNFEVIGHMDPVLVVSKNNPKNIIPELKSLTDPELRVVLGSPESCSIGVKTRSILQSVNLFDEVMENVLYLTTDAKNITRAIIDGSADIGIEWKVAVSGEVNSKYMDFFSLRSEIALSEKIGLGLLKYSIFPELALIYFDYAVSDKGREIFKRYGF